MNKSFAQTVGTCAVLGLAGAFFLFVSESVVSSAFAEIHVRTYAFFFVLYVVFGATGGALLGLLLNAARPRLSAKWLQVETSSFLPATALLVVFYAYGFYYINEKLTAGVGALAPVSLLADLLFLASSIGIFFVALSAGDKEHGEVRNLFTVAVAPITFLVATNIRFFIWQPPHTRHGELFLGIACFASAGLAGALLSLLIAKLLPRNVRSVSSASLAGIAIVVAIFSGRPSTDSFFTDKPEVEGKALQAVKPKNIIWIVTDTARRDHVSVYGGDRKTTPNLEKFARDARVFDHAIATAPWTLPSHASMFTGMYPSKHGAHYVGDAIFSTPLLPQNITIAELLTAYGYETAAVCANNAGLSRALGCGQGFHFYFDARPMVFSLFWGKLLLRLPDDFRIDDLWVNEVALSSEINPIAEKWLDNVKKDHPFFLFVNYMEPHGGIAFIPAPYDSMYGFNRERQKEVFKDFDSDRIIHFRDHVKPEERGFWTSYVERKVTFMDFKLGQLIDKLKTMDLYDDSMIIINSDHGELFGEHNSFGHNTDLYNELISIPMMVKYPGSEKKGRFEKVVQTVDIMPEVLSYIGADIPEEVQGQPFEQATHDVVAELFQQVHNAHAKSNPRRYYRDLKAIFGTVAGDSLKYIWSSDYKSELFDLSHDPGELTNIAGEAVSATDQMQGKLEDWKDSFTPFELTKDLKLTNSAERNDLIERLKSLGYVK